MQGEDHGTRRGQGLSQRFWRNVSLSTICCFICLVRSDFMTVLGAWAAIYFSSSGLLHKVWLDGWAMWTGTAHHKCAFPAWRRSKEPRRTHEERLQNQMLLQWPRLHPEPSLSWRVTCLSSLPTQVVLHATGLSRCCSLRR